MKNVIFISPNFPTNYWMFCKELKENGLNVLGIGDQPYHELSPELKDSLTEYYKVDSLGNYDNVFRAVAFFSHKYGKVDFLESNNEFWLEQDAKLREDFNIPGLHPADMDKIKHKSKMKEYYHQAGLVTARYHMVDQWNDCIDFIRTVGYPVVVKPDNGVGASHTYKLKCDDDMRHFLEERYREYPDVPYIMEEFVNATVNTYDAIVGPEGNILFETGNVTVDSIMDTVANYSESICYIRKELPQDIIDAGKATIKAFGIKNRFVHLEFFRLNEDQEGLGKKGQVMALEVNMRPAGVFIPDMMNYAHSTNVYKIWADMVAYGSTLQPQFGHQFCIFIGRRDNKAYINDMQAISNKYGNKIKSIERLADAVSAAMGNVVYIATFDTEDELNGFIKDMVASY